DRSSRRASTAPRRTPAATRSDGSAWLPRPPRPAAATARGVASGDGVMEWWSDGVVGHHSMPRLRLLPGQTRRERRRGRRRTAEAEEAADRNSTRWRPIVSDGGTIYRRGVSPADRIAHSTVPASAPEPASALAPPPVRWREAALPTGYT